MSSTKTVKGLLKGLRYISKVFDDEEDEQEMQIGYPTDVKHVAHIGCDGADSNNGPRWMNDFKNPEDVSSPKPDEAKKIKEGKRNTSKMSLAIPPKDNASSPAPSPGQNGTKKSRNRRHTWKSSANSPTGQDSWGHRSSRRDKGTDPTQPGVTKKVRRRREVSSESGSTKSNKSKEKNLSMDGAELELAGDELKSQG